MMDGLAVTQVYYPASHYLGPGINVPTAIGAGCEIVNIARLGDFALIAFHWYETADETYVRVVNLRDFADRDFAA